MEEIVLPSGRLQLGAEIARGSFGAVHDAMLYGARVCAKVRRVLCCVRGSGVCRASAPTLRGACASAWRLASLIWAWWRCRGSCRCSFVVLATEG
jgi:hypothetical protein